MTRYHVTLKASLAHGVFYWVCDVEAEDEEDAAAVAEALFLQEIEAPTGWAFDETEIVPG
ncbi:MAG: hypothetical protein ACTSRY_01390 [Alphaproteobacteria bacterium]